MTVLFFLRGMATRGTLSPGSADPLDPSLQRVNASDQ
jgi:hypothetical protein